MFENVAKRIAIILFTLTIFFLLSSSNYAKFFDISNNMKDNCKIAILSDTKELYNEQEIFFNVQDNGNVEKGKFAPGLKAIAEIEINIIDFNEPVDILVNADTSKFGNSFKFISKINDINYTLGTVKTISLGDNMLFSNEDGKLVFTFEVEWLDNVSDEDQSFVLSEKIKVPFYVIITQHIV